MKLSVKIVAKKRKQQVSFVTDRFDCKFKVRTTIFFEKVGDKNLSTTAKT